jgi:hypothetical protein
MHQANHASNGINEVNRAAIGYVNAEAKAALICDKPVALLEALVSADSRIDNTDLFPVDLLRCDEWHIGKTAFAADLPVDAVQSRERFRLIVRHLKAGHAQGESVDDAGQCA